MRLRCEKVLASPAVPRDRVYVLVDDEVGREAEHVAVALLIGSPTEAERHEEEPRALQQRHLVVQVEVTEA